MFWRKVGYIHRNPVEAGHVDRPEDYIWVERQALTRREDGGKGTGIPCQGVVDRLGLGAVEIE